MGSGRGGVTPLGPLPFFIDFLKTVELFKPWVEECPLTYRSNHAPEKVEVLGTLSLSVLAGHTRYAHIESVRYDAVNPGLWAFLRGLPQHALPYFIRGDCNFGNERDTNDAETRGMPYLFKLRQTGKVKTLIKQVFGRGDWEPAGQGWEGVEDRLRLTGWTKKRRVIVLRRKIKAAIALAASAEPALAAEQLQFIETDEGAVQYEYVVLVTSLTDPIATLAQHYRDRDPTADFRLNAGCASSIGTTRSTRANTPDATWQAPMSRTRICRTPSPTCLNSATSFHEALLLQEMMKAFVVHPLRCGSAASSRLKPVQRTFAFSE